MDILPASYYAQPLPPSNPVKGSVWLDTRDTSLFIYSGVVWQRLSGSGSLEKDSSDEYGGGVPDVGPENVPHETSKCDPVEASEKLASFIENLEIPDPRGRLDYYVIGVDPYAEETEPENVMWFKNFTKSG